MSHSTFVQCLNFPRETLISRLWCRSQPCTRPCPLSAAPDLWLSPQCQWPHSAFCSAPLYRQSPAGPGQAPAGPGEHMVTSMGNIIMICIRQQSAQNISSAHVCLFKIKCFRFYDIAIILSRPPPVINMENLQFIGLREGILGLCHDCNDADIWWGHGDNILPQLDKSPLLHSLPQLCSIVMCKGYLLRSHYPAMQHSNVSMQLSGLRGPTLSSHEVIWLLRRKTDPCRHAEWWLLIDSFLLHSSLQPINSVFFPRPLSVSTTHQGPPPVAGDHE